VAGTPPVVGLGVVGVTAGGVGAGAGVVGLGVGVGVGVAVLLQASSVTDTSNTRANNHMYFFITLLSTYSVLYTLFPSNVQINGEASDIQPPHSAVRCLNPVR
jgi:hypothetical protein